MDKIEENKTYKINEVEVFSVGEWNGDKYEIADMHEMVAAFNTLKSGLRPYLKLGHDDKQKLAKSSGLPSVGWVENLYVKGTKLIADLNYIPEKVYKLIKSRAYRKVSCEIYWNLTVAGNKYSRVLGGIAFLGAENPGVMNLDDILGNYSFLNNNNSDIALFSKEDTFKTYSFALNSKLEDTMADEKSEKEIKLETEIELQKKNYEKVEADLKVEVDAKAALEKENLELKTFKADAQKKEIELAIELEKVKRATYIADLESKKIATPAMKDILEELLSDKKEFSIKEKAVTKEDLLSQLLTLSSEASKVNFSEQTRADFSAGQKTEEDKIQKYMDDHKCTYVQAYKAVMKDNK